MTGRAEVQSLALADPAPTASKEERRQGRMSREACIDAGRDGNKH
jgi:hypothetical protein